MDRNDFVKKWKCKFGCDGFGLCWCPICRNLEKVWDDVIKVTIKELKRLKD